MTMLNISRTRELLQKFEFKRLFVEELGWSNPPAALSRSADTYPIEDETFQCQAIAELSGALVYEVTSSSGKLPDANQRLALHHAVEGRHYEHLLIFVDAQRTQSIWYWVKHDEKREHPRDHYYLRNQPGDLFLSKLSGMVVGISEFDADGNLPITTVAKRLKDALDVERATRKFFNEYDALRLDLAGRIEGIANERDVQWYTSVLLNRLMFIFFLQRRALVNRGDRDYLQHKLAESKIRGKDLYYQDFLRTLFFEGFAKPADQRSAQARERLGDIKYLNGGLFLEHHIEQKYPKIHIPDVAFEQVYAVLGAYSWNLDDTPGGKDDDLNPAVLGYIFEKYINQKEFGAYYTREQITEYLCERTIHRVILNAVNDGLVDLPGLPTPAGLRHFDSMPELLMNLDAPLCKRLLNDILPKLSLLDPACGSGAFLVAAMKTLINVYAAVIGRIDFLHDLTLNQWRAQVLREHKSIDYFIRKSIITNNLFGVDIMEEATEIARLRLFLALVACAENEDQLEPLPNIDFNILTGNSLIGFLRVDEAAYDQRNPQMSLLNKPYDEVVAEKNRMVTAYRHAATLAQDLHALREEIEQHRQAAMLPLNELLLDQFRKLGIKYEHATWDAKKNEDGRVNKRAVTLKDIEALKPFHWGYEFDEVMNRRGGFDAIITNPPWEIFKPQAREFFAEYSGLVTKNKMTIKEFEKEQTKLLKKPDVRAGWLEYQSRFPHVSLYYRSAPQYVNQISIVNGKKAGSDINLYKLFTEQCYNLLRSGGQCGIVIPSGIYTDLGAKQLREMLFTQTRIDGLFCLENRQTIFENVDSRFKFVVLTFEKGGSTTRFNTAFMRHDVNELAHFPKEGALPISVDLIRKLSPDSLSVMEFKGNLDVQIAEKMLRFPLLGEELPDTWNLRLTREFDMTNDSHLFKTEPGAGRLPLYEGKMIHQFEAHFAEPRYWVNEKEGRKTLLGREFDTGQKLDYQGYRLGFRDIARNTDTRTLICSVIPPTFHGNKLPTVCVYDDDKSELISTPEQLVLCTVWNSFTVDWVLRLKVTTTVNFFYIYQLPIPRLTSKDPAFKSIVERAAKLICTTPEFDDLAKEMGLGSHKNGVTDPVQRARLRAELDGLVAHLYGLTEEEFVHILGAFPLVSEPIIVAAHNAYRDVRRGLVL